MSEKPRHIEPVDPDPDRKLTVNMHTALVRGRSVVQWAITRTRDGVSLVGGVLGREDHADVGSIARVVVAHPDDTVGPRYAYDTAEHTEQDPSSEEARRRIILRTVIGGAAVLGGSLLAKKIHDTLRDEDE